AARPAAKAEGAAGAAAGGRRSSLRSGHARGAHRHQPARTDRDRARHPGDAAAALARGGGSRLIASHVWAHESDAMGSNTIDVHLARLRSKLTGGMVRIETVRGVGYRIVGT